MNNSSIFSPYSFGIVIGDKPPGTIAEIFPIELRGLFTGDPSELKDIAGKLTDELSSNKEDIKLKLSNTIKAQWLPISNSNRLTAPDICNGETVMIYRFGDSQIFFWDTIFNESDLRKKEHVFFGCSNTDDIKEVLNDTNTYFWGVDTKNKDVVIIHTSDNDGELTTYDINIKTKDGILTVTDGKENSIVLDSGKDEITITTNKKINLNTKEVNIVCDTYNLKCTDAHITASTLDIIADTTHTGKYDHTGAYTHIGTAKRTGTFQLQGTLTAVPPILTTSTMAQT